MEDHLDWLLHYTLKASCSIHIVVKNWSKDGLSPSFQSMLIGEVRIPNPTSDSEYETRGY